MYMITKGGWGHIRSIDQLQIISAVHMYMMKKKGGSLGTHSFDRSIIISAVHMYMI